MLDSLARKAGGSFDDAAMAVGTSTLTRHLFFLGCTLVATVFIGYHFGTFDQAIHIPFLSKYADPTLYPGDPFLEMRFEHYSFFWLLFLPFQRAGILEITMLVAHLLFTYCTFWAVWDLSLELFHNTVSAFVAVLSIVLTHISFGGFPLIEFSLLNRTAVLPFLLWAMVLGLRGRTGAMFMLLGLLLNFHLISVSFVMAMVGLDLLYRRQWKTILVGGLVFLLFASPILAWRGLYRSAPMLLTPDYEWFDAVSRYVLANLFYLFAPQAHILFSTFSGLASVALFVIARRSVESRHNQTMTLYVIAAMLLVGLQVVGVLYPVTFLMQLQIVRAGIPATILGYIYFSHYLVTQVRSKLQISVLVISPTALFSLAVWALRKRIKDLRPFDIGSAAGAVIVMIAVVISGISLGFWHPGIYLYGFGDSWNDVQAWARDNTPQDATFLTPPQQMGPFISDWRAFSERPSVAIMSDLLEVSVVPLGYKPWRERFDAIAPGAQEKFKGDFFENIEITRAAYESLTQEQIDVIAFKYGARYMVSRKPRTYGYPVVYQNADYTVYQIGP